MSKIEETREILKELQVPAKQQTDLCCYVHLAMADIKVNDEWSSAANGWIGIHDVIAYTKKNYRLTDEMLSLICCFGTEHWETEVWDCRYA